MVDVRVLRHAQYIRKIFIVVFSFSLHCFFFFFTPQWGAEDAETKVPSVENTELEGSPFKAWGRPYMLRLLPGTSAFFPNLS